MSGLLEKAKRQFHRGDLKIALATAGRAMQQDRRNPETYFLLAAIHEQQGDIEAAAASAETTRSPAAYTSCSAANAN